MKKINFILIACSLVMTIINIYNAVVNSLSVNWLSLTSLAPIFIALYELSDFLYVSVNKFKAWLINKTVNFKVSFAIYTDESDYKAINNNFYSAMKESQLGFDNGSNRNIEPDYTEMKLKTKNGLNIKTTVSIGNDDTYESVITITFDFQISNRSLEENWKLFKEFKDSFMGKTNTLRQRYDLCINMEESGFNPFYRLTLKSVDAKDIENVNLSFKEKNTNVKIYKNKIFASSKKCSDLDNILKKYIPLTRVY